jgi:hypothetical protein
LIFLVTVHSLAHRSDYIRAEDGSSGAKLNNGSWTGVLGMMRRGQVQVADVPLVITPERGAAFDFTFPLTKTEYIKLFMKILT